VRIWHLVTPEFPPLMGGVSEHSRVLAAAAVHRGREVHVWTRSGALPAKGIHVHTTLGTFAAADLALTDAALERYHGPRDLLVQWVPHGFGFRGMNVNFARWIAARAARGDRVDVMVHEPFVDYFGGSWLQPVRAVLQRYMARTALGSARRVWMSIPGWEPRLAPMLAGTSPLRVLPVPGTIPVDRSAAAVAEVRRRLLGSASRLIGYFGTGGRYAEAALEMAVRELAARRDNVAVVCIGQGSREVARRLRPAAEAGSHRDGGDGVAIHATGALQLSALSHHLSACDVLLQPYVDGVSGRRTTTISALEHGIPVATTCGALSEPYWAETEAAAVVPAAAPHLLCEAASQLLAGERNAHAKSAAAALYAARFAPEVALAPLFDNDE
jgi:glycosyltransferase involved in cell wall biosynthesis